MGLDTTREALYELEYEVTERINRTCSSINNGVHLLSLLCVEMKTIRHKDKH